MAVGHLKLRQRRVSKRIGVSDNYRHNYRATIPRSFQHEGQFCAQDEVRLKVVRADQWNHDFGRLKRLANITRRVGPPPDLRVKPYLYLKRPPQGVEVTA